MIRETLHCCRVSVGQTGEDEAILSKQLASSGNTGKVGNAGERSEEVVEPFMSIALSNLS